MEMEAFEQTLSLQRDGDGDVKTPVIGNVVNKLKERNKLLQPIILIDFKAIFNVMQRTLIIRRGGDGGF